MTTEQKVIKNKLGLLKLAETLGSVSQACKVMGYSRDSFYRFRDLYDTGGALALQDLSRRKPVPKNRVDAAIESEILALAIDKPAYGQVSSFQRAEEERDVRFPWWSSRSLAAE